MEKVIYAIFPWTNETHIIFVAEEPPEIPQRYYTCCSLESAKEMLVESGEAIKKSEEMVE